MSLDEMKAWISRVEKNSIPIDWIEKWCILNPDGSAKEMLEEWKKK